MHLEISIWPFKVAQLRSGVNSKVKITFVVSISRSQVQISNFPPFFSVYTRSVFFPKKYFTCQTVSWHFLKKFDRFLADFCQKIWIFFSGLVTRIFQGPDVDLSLFLPRHRSLFLKPESLDFFVFELKWKTSSASLRLFSQISRHWSRYVTDHVTWRQNLKLKVVFASLEKFNLFTFSQFIAFRLIEGNFVSSQKFSRKKIILWSRWNFFASEAISNWIKGWQNVRKGKSDDVWWSTQGMERAWAWARRPITKTGLEIKERQKLGWALN